MALSQTSSSSMDRCLWATGHQSVHPLDQADARLHTLTAVAMDNLGIMATSAPVHTIVARYTPEITNGNISILLLAVATNLAAPDYAISPPGDTHRLFVVEQNGLLRVIQDGRCYPSRRSTSKAECAAAERDQPQ